MPAVTIATRHQEPDSSATPFDDPREAVASVRPVFRRLMVSEPTRRFRYAPPRYTDYEILLVDRGSCACTLNGVAMTLQPDDVLIVRPGDKREDVCEPPLRYVSVLFQLRPGTEGARMPSLLKSSVFPSLQRFKVDRALLGPTVERLERETENPDPTTFRVQDALLAELFWGLVRFVPEDILSRRFLGLSSRDKFRFQLLKLFRENLGRKVEVGELAERMEMSETTLSQRCTAVLGLPVAHAFAKYRLTHARELLGTTSLPVKDIAALVGFRAPSHFARAFRQLFGQTPGAYRRGVNPKQTGRPRKTKARKAPKKL